MDRSLINSFIDDDVADDYLDGFLYRFKLDSNALRMA